MNSGGISDLRMVKLIAHVLGPILRLSGIVRQPEGEISNVP